MSTHPVPMVSVILVTYNHENFLRQALESVASQKVDFDLELIISEDHSTDSTRKIIEGFVKGYAGNLSLLYSDTNLNSAIVATRAFRAARGRYIAYLDGDDYWDSDYKLARQVEFMEANPDCVLSHHDVARVDATGTVLRLLPGLQRTGSIDDLIAGNFIQSCSCMIRRSAIEPFPGWLDSFSVLDWPLYMVAAEHGSIGWIEGVLGHYRIHGGSAWATTTLPRQWAGSIALLDMLEEHFGEGRRAVFAASRANLVRQLQESLADEDGRGVGEMVARERELAANERAERVSAASRSAVAEAEQRAVSASMREAAALSLVVQKEQQSLQREHQVQQQEQIHAERERLYIEREHRFLQQEQQHADRGRLWADEKIAFRGEADRLLMLLTENAHLLRRERRVGRRLLAIGVAVLSVLAIAVVWLAFRI